MSAGTQVLSAMTLEQGEGPGPQDVLLARARAGDQAAFGALVRTFQRTVYSLALRMLRNPQDAEDLAQEVFLQMHRSLCDLSSGSHLAFWLRKVTLHRAIDRLRRNPWRELAPLTDVEMLASETPDADPLLSTRLAQLVGQLAPAPRAVILLRYQEDLDPVQIARTLGMSINTVKSHLKRSLSLLRERLGAAGGDGAAPPGGLASPTPVSQGATE
jgi:RNA polymerase sigma-70 factor, ECF subfamily